MTVLAALFAEPLTYSLRHEHVTDRVRKPCRQRRSRSEAHEAGDGAEAVTQAIKLRPDVVLLDIRMPKMDGIEATRRLLEATDGACRVLMLTTFDLDEYVYGAMKEGASGFLLKTVPPRQLVSAVRDVAAGEALLAPEITRRLIEEFVRQPRPGNKPRAQHTHTQRARRASLNSPGYVQRGDRQGVNCQRSDRQVSRRPHPGETRRTGPSAGRRPRLRVRTGPAGLAVTPSRHPSAPQDPRLCPAGQTRQHQGEPN